MSENDETEYQVEEVESKKPTRMAKKGKPDQRSIKSAANVSKARTKVRAFLKAGKQILHNSDAENESSGDEVVDLVIRPKTHKPVEQDDDDKMQGKGQTVRRVPLKKVLQRQDAVDDTDDYYKPDVKQKKDTSHELKYEKLLKELEGGRAEQASLIKQVQELKQGISETASKEHRNDVEIMRKKMLLRF